MLKLVEEHGTRYWALIGAKLNGRTGKQVCTSPASAGFTRSTPLFL